MLALQTLPNDPGEPSHGGGFRRAIEEEVDPALLVDLRGQEEGGLALVNPGQPIRVVGVLRREGRNLLGVLEQGLALQLPGSGGEPVYDLLELSREVTFIGPGSWSDALFPWYSGPRRGSVPGEMPPT